MAQVFHDATVTRATRRRLTEELDELDDALRHSCNAAILDGLVDVKYYIDRLAACHGINSDCFSRYAAVKSALRENGVRCKALELRLASEFVAESQLEMKWSER